MRMIWILSRDEWNEFKNHFEDGLDKKKSLKKLTGGNGSRYCSDGGPTGNDRKAAMIDHL